MPHNRFYSPLKLEKNQHITLTDDELKHLKVMRLSKGESCEIINGKYQLATAIIKDIQNNQANLTILDVKKKSPPLTKILCLALLKPKKMELILEKATELAITEFWFFIAVKSEIKEIKKSQKQRFEKILISAMKQCGRLDLPKFQLYQSIQKIPDFDGLRFYGDIHKNAIPFKNFNNKKPTLIVIGPEMGFTEKEIAYLKQVNMTGVKLAEFTLRAETAAITSAALMS